MSDVVPPIPSVPLIDPRTGLIAREWYRFMIALWDRTGGAAGPSGGGGDTTSLDTLFGDEFQRELLGTTNQVIVTDGTQMSGRTTFATPQDIDTAADVVFGSATLEGTGTGLTVNNNSVLGNSADDTTTVTGYFNPYVAFGNGTDWTSYTLGGVQFTSPSSVGNAKARAYVRLLQKPYTAAPTSANDITSLVGLWVGGNYAGATTTALPLYLGGMYTSSAQWPAVVINTVGQLLAADSVIGFSATPAYSFQSDTDLGWYRAASNQLRITGGGNDMIAFDGNSPSGGYQSQITVYSQLVSGPVGAPSASAPQIALSYSNTGFYSVGANDIGFSTNGVKAGQAVSGRWLLGPTIADDTITRLQVEGGIRATNWEKIAGLSLYAAVHG